MNRVIVMPNKETARNFNRGKDGMYDKMFSNINPKPTKVFLYGKHNIADTIAWRLRKSHRDRTEYVFIVSQAFMCGGRYTPKLQELAHHIGMTYWFKVDCEGEITYNYYGGLT